MIGTHSPAAPKPPWEGGVAEATEVNALLRRLLSVEGGSPFVALRDAESLPDTLSGDLAVVCVPGTSLADARRFLRECGKAEEWRTIAINRRTRMMAVTVLHFRTKALLRVDVVLDISVFGVPLLGPDLWLEESAVKNDIRRLSLRAETAVAVVQRVLHEGLLNKPKYLGQLRSGFASDDEDWLRSTFRTAFGGKLGAELGDSDAGGGLAQVGSGRRARAILGALGPRLLRHPGRTVGGVLAYGAGQVRSMLSPGGLVGTPDDTVPGLPGQPLDLEFASRLSVDSVRAPGVRAPASSLRTADEGRSTTKLANRWRFWTPLRWVSPSAFLWLQAKRFGVVIVDRLPVGLRLLRRLGVGRSWMARTGSTGDGSFVAVLGPDGVGKTTVARGLIQRHGGPTGYLHFRPHIWSRPPATPPEAGPQQPTWPTRSGTEIQAVLGWVRLARTWLQTWVGYWLHVRPLLAKGALVVADRWAYRYQTQPVALKYFGPHWLAVAAISTMPRPDVAFFLSTDPREIIRRKDEVPEAALLKEMDAWRRVDFDEVVWIDAGDGPSTVLRSIEGALGWSGDGRR